MFEPLHPPIKIPCLFGNESKELSLSPKWRKGYCRPLALWLDSDIQSPYDAIRLHCCNVPIGHQSSCVFL